MENDNAPHKLLERLLLQAYEQETEVQWLSKIGQYVHGYYENELIDDFFWKDQREGVAAVEQLESLRFSIFSREGDFPPSDVLSWSRHEFARVLFEALNEVRQDPSGESLFLKEAGLLVEGTSIKGRRLEGRIAELKDALSILEGAPIFTEKFMDSSRTEYKGFFSDALVATRVGRAEPDENGKFDHWNTRERWVSERMYDIVSEGGSPIPFMREYLEHIQRLSKNAVTFRATQNTDMLRAKVMFHFLKNRFLDYPYSLQLSEEDIWPENSEGLMHAIYQFCIISCGLENLSSSETNKGKVWFYDWIAGSNAKLDEARNKVFSEFKCRQEELRP